MHFNSSHTENFILYKSDITLNILQIRHFIFKPNYIIFNALQTNKVISPLPVSLHAAYIRLPLKIPPYLESYL